ncbi:MAG TPA: RNA methyltransferase [Treponema sp.]|nr:RNA methyltransferase [Treponema sp.]
MHNKLTDELAVCGLNAALAVCEHHPETVNRLFLREDRLKLFTGICKQLAERKRPYKICLDEELERISKSVHHQGVVAMIEEPVVAPLSREELDEWAEEGKTGVLLHSVGNDHNLGAIARAAAFFDVDFLILNENDSEARLSTSAYRVAEGGLEHIATRKITNSAAFLKDASKRIITAAADVRARLRIRDFDSVLREKSAKLRRGGRAGVVLVLGNEETGLPSDVKNQCSCLFRIPGTGKIESLNVAQAAALFLHELYEL